MITAHQKIFIRRSFTNLIYIISEIEHLLCPTKYAFLFRRFYLKLQKVKYGKRISVGSNFFLAKEGKLIVGDDAAFGRNALIGNFSTITIGDNFIGASGITIYSGTHIPKTMNWKKQPVKIGSRVWCGVNVTILPKVSIGDDVVIGAGSVVTKDIPSGSVAFGVPAKVMRGLDRSNNDIDILKAL